MAPGPSSPWGISQDQFMRPFGFAGYPKDLDLDPLELGGLVLWDAPNTELVPRIGSPGHRDPRCVVVRVFRFPLLGLAWWELRI